jgi:anaerobic selenocysteine-containing dehydrogenase
MKRHAAHMLQFRPGTDVALLNAMMHVIVADGLVDEGFIDSRTAGYPALKEHLADLTPEAMSPICGIAPDAIRAAAQRLQGDEARLEAELLLQYALAKQLQTTVMADRDTPANQQAQVLNSCVAALAKLQDTQARFYSQERFKRIENILVAALKKWPAELAEEFLGQYEQMLDGSQV